MKVAIITGGTRGIGLAIAKKFLTSNYRVALIYRNDDDQANATLESLNNDHAIAIKADITRADDRVKLLDETKRKFNRFDVLINNAGILRMGRFIDVDPAVFDEVMQCNLYAPIFLSQKFAQELIASNRPGSIINILSVGGHRAGNLSYCTSKAALLHATRCMAREIARYQIRANTISPGFLETDLNITSRERDPEGWSKRVGQIPMKRVAATDEIAGAALYLASDDASYTTAADIIIDGGLTA